MPLPPVQEFIEHLKSKTESGSFRIPSSGFIPGYLNLIYQKNSVIITAQANSMEMDDIIFNQGDVFEKDIIFDGGNFSKIIFRGGTFKGNLIFRNGTYNSFVSIRGGVFQKKLVFLGGEFKHWVGTLNGLGNKDNPLNEDETELAEEPLIINSLEIEGGSVVNNFWIHGGKIKNMEIKSVTPARIHIKQSDDRLEQPDGTFTRKFDSLPEIDRLYFHRYFHKDSFVQVSGIKVNELRFEEFTNLGNISITDLEIDPGNKIIMHNADMGKASFIDCDFKKNILDFKSSQISNISFAGTNWPEQDNFQIPQSDENYKELQKRFLLNQLKKIHEERKDWIKAGKYHSEEMNVQIEINKKEDKNFGELAVLTMNKWTNNHGQDWVRALKIVLVVHIVLYTVYCSMLGYTLDLCPSKKSWIEFGRLLSYSLEYLNPIRKSEFLAKALYGNENIPSIAIIWDSISKIVFAYLLFQFVAAFRKHGRTK